MTRFAQPCPGSWPRSWFGRARCILADDVAFLETGKDYDFRVATRAGFDRTLLKGTGVFHPDKGMISRIKFHALTGHDKRVFYRAEVDVQRGGEIRQEFRVGALHGEAGRKYA